MSALIASPDSTRRPTLGRALAVGLLIVAAVPSLAPTAEAYVWPGPILALYDSWTEPIQALAAAGFIDCANSYGSGACFSAVNPTQFATVNLQDRKVLYIGTDPTGSPSALDSALTARAADIGAFVAAGGAVIAYAVPSAKPQDYLPDGAQISPSHAAGDIVQVTLAGLAHPALGGATSAELSNWQSSYHNAYTAFPAWMTVLAEGPANQPLTLAGNYGAGCVFLTGQAPDFWTFWGPTPSVQDAARELVRSTVMWGLNCGTGNPGAFLVTTPHPGYVDIFSFGGAPSMVHDPGLSCSPLQWNGVVAETYCAPISYPPLGTQWGCQGPAVGVAAAGLGAVKGATECQGLPATSCTAVAPSPGVCADNPGFWAIGLFTVICRAEVTGLVSSWTVHCAFPDP